ncbi:hypothetical protein O9929_27040 [Vibrio lentus]|nr:hypothetical protein [Vibrio lentus]
MALLNLQPQFDGDYGFENIDPGLETATLIVMSTMGLIISTLDMAKTIQKLPLLISLNKLMI